MSTRHPSREPRSARPPVPVDVATLGPTQQTSAAARAEHVRPVVIDANVLVEEVVRRLPHMRRGEIVRPARSSALADALRANAIRLYGKSDVIEEAMRHLAEVTLLKPRDVHDAIEVLSSEYVSRMRVVDASTIEIDDPKLRAVAARHGADEPTARLACLLAPAYVLTRDKDLIANGFGEWFEEGHVPASWTAIAYTILDRSFDSKVEAGTKAAAGLASLTGAGLAWAFRSHPRIASGLVGAVAATAILTRRSSIWVNLGTALRSMLQHGTNELILHQADAQKAKAQLAEFERAQPGLGTAEAIVARHLALAPVDGLSAAELYDITGHRFAVRPILEAHPTFVRDSAGRWHLGSSARMPG